MRIILWENRDDVDVVNITVERGKSKLSGDVVYRVFGTISLAYFFTAKVQLTNNEASTSYLLWDKEEDAVKVAERWLKYYEFDVLTDIEKVVFDKRVKNLNNDPEHFV